MRTQADEVLDMLRDPSKLQVALVTLAETTPVNETIETAFRLEDRVAVRLAPVVVNGVDGGLDEAPRHLSELAGGLPAECPERDALVAAAAFKDERRDVQRAAIARLTEALPIGQVHVSWVPSARLDREAVDALARSARAHDPANVEIAE